MKLRLRGDSLRLRLTQTEVSQLHEQGSWEDTVTLGPAGLPRLCYRVEAGDSSTVRFVSGENTVVSVVLPSAEVARWAKTNEVGLYFTTGWNLKVAVEKDFRCLDEQREEDESDNFANPNAGSPHQGACDVD